MGLCWSTVPPEEDEDDLTTNKEGLKYLKKSKVGTTQFQTAYGLGGSFSKEEVRLRELLAAVRTGLVFSPTEFSVLPGITTTAKVKFTLGSTELSPNVEEPKKESNSDENEDQEDEVEDESTDDDEDEEGGDKVKAARSKPEEPYELKLPLTGESWTKDLTIELEVWPAVGPFSGRNLVFHWCENLLKIMGSKRGEISVCQLPESFETERDFCKCCLLTVYQQNKTSNLNFNEGMELNNLDNMLDDDNVSVLPLTTLAYKFAIANLDAIPDSLVMPAKVYHLFFGSQSPISVSIKLWPESCEREFTASRMLQVKAGILSSEFVYLLREHFGIPPNYSLKLYHNYKQLQSGTVLTTKHKEIDCFVVSYPSTTNATGGSYTSLNEEEEEEESFDSSANLVVSLVGSGMQNMQVDLGMQLKDFDSILRSKFNLQEDSFLIIRSDDDFAPQYAADDNWKCTYPFSVPNNSFAAGLRRSFRRMTRRRDDNRLTQSQRGGISATSADSDGTFSPLMAKVVTLLSSDGRQFPSNSGKYGLSVQELYDSMPMYRMSLDQCGIHPYSIIQVFEVTGPSIPITFRVVSDYSQAGSSASDGTSLTTNQDSSIRTRLANIMDVNLNWSVDTFLQYVDAIISPASVVRRKRLCLQDSYIEDSKDVDLSEEKLGKLLDSWRPMWWPIKDGKTRAQLSVKDIDPAEFLVVEKY